MIEITSAEIINFHTRAEWLEARQSGLGGSDAPAILDLSPHKAALGVYADKTGLNGKEQDSGILRRGRKLEPIVVDDYVEESKRTVERYDLHFWRSLTSPHLFHSSDGIIAPVEGKDGPGLLECKTAAYIKRDELIGNAPDDWLVQVQHGLGVLGLKWASLAVWTLLQGEMVWIDIDRNEEFIKTLQEKELEFWARVMDKNPPPPDSSESAREAIRRLYPKESGETVDLAESLMEADDQLQMAKAKIKELEAVKDGAENAIKAAIGEATFGILPNGVRFSFKSVHKYPYQVKEQNYRQLRRSTK